MLWSHTEYVTPTFFSIKLFNVPYLHTGFYGGIKITATFKVFRGFLDRAGYKPNK